MKLNSTRTSAVIIITSLAIVIVSLMVAVIFLCRQPGVNCGSVFSMKTCIGEHMRKLNPEFKKPSGSNCQVSPYSEVSRPVFVNWRRLYWGNLAELTKPDEFFAPCSSVQTTGADQATGMENPIALKNEVLKQITQDLRSALKAFEKQYCVRINWFKNDPTMPDVTTQFINFWDAGVGNVKDTNERNIEEKTDRGGKER